MLGGGKRGGVTPSEPTPPLINQPPSPFPKISPPDRNRRQVASWGGGAPQLPPRGEDKREKRLKNNHHYKAKRLRPPTAPPCLAPPSLAPPFLAPNPSSSPRIPPPKGSLVEEVDPAAVTVAPSQFVGLLRDQAAHQGQVGLVEGGRGRGGPQPRGKMVIGLPGGVGGAAARAELLAVLELLAELRHPLLLLQRGEKKKGGKKGLGNSP